MTEPAAAQPSVAVPPRAGGPPTARVVLLGRSGCHLCDEARQVVERVCAAAGEEWVEVDVDGPGTAPDGRPLADVYGELVPVVEVDGRRVGHWQVDPERLGDAVRGR